MARVSKTNLLCALQGALGESVVFKQYKDKVVVTQFPSMPKRKPTELQLLNRKRFVEATRYSQSVLRNKALKAEYEKKLQPGERVCDVAKREWFEKNKHWMKK